MIKFDEAKALIEDCKIKFERIKEVYDHSVSNTNIEKSLLIEIKNFMENLRSALDYTAYGLFEKYGFSSKSNPNIYFPYAGLTLDKVEFRNQNIVEKKIPGLSASQPDIVAKLESYQHFEAQDNRWLPKFMDLNNENKHQQLTPQIVKEKKYLKLSSKGRTSILHGIITLNKGAQIKMGDMIITGPQTYDANNPPKTFGNGKVEVIKWIFVKFSTNNEPVLPFLEKALERIEKIVDELSKM